MGIIENRKLRKEDELRFDDKIQTQTKEEEEEEKKDDDNDKLLIGGPDDIKCDNCGKWVHSMSIQMHTVHCIRQYIKCKLCEQIIKRQDEEEHLINFHKKITCICSKVCVGKIEFDKHTLNECQLRLMTCQYCDKTNIPYLEYSEHEIVCKERIIKCNICGIDYIAKNKLLHNCGIICVLCGERINDSKNKLLHLLTSCKERRAVCNYCGILRRCNDMESHRKHCGSRSEKCTKCDQFVSLMNMEPHLQSNCQWFNNNQLSVKKQPDRVNKEVQDNPYLDQQLLVDQLFQIDDDDHNDDDDGDGD